MSVSEEIKITVLLKEYDTLREEIGARSAARYQLLAVIVAIGALVGSKDAGGFQLVVRAVLTVGLAALVWWWLWHDIVRCSRGVRDVEARVNSLAGDNLLTWETTRNR